VSRADIDRLSEMAAALRRRTWAHNVETGFRAELARMKRRAAEADASGDHQTAAAIRAEMQDTIQAHWAEVFPLRVPS